MIRYNLFAAASYDMRLSEDALQLQNNFSLAFQATSDMIVNGSLSSPQSARRLEQVTLSLSNTNFTAVGKQYFIAIIARNRFNRQGEVSNIDSFTFVNISDKSITRPPPMITTQQDTSVTTPSKISPSSKSSLLLLCVTFLLSVGYHSILFCA